MKKILLIITVLMLLALPLLVIPAFAAETSGATYTSPNGGAEGLAEYLNEQEYIDHTHSIYVDEGRVPVEMYLGLEYCASNSLSFGARALCDVANLDRDEVKKAMRYEVGATYKFGPGTK